MVQTNYISVIDKKSGLKKLKKNTSNCEFDQKYETNVNQKLRDRKRSIEQIKEEEYDQYTYIPELSKNTVKMTKDQKSIYGRYQDDYKKTQNELNEKRLIKDLEIQRSMEQFKGKKVNPLNYSKRNLADSLSN